MMSRKRKKKLRPGYNPAAVAETKLARFWMGKIRSADRLDGYDRPINRQTGKVVGARRLRRKPR
jgi:hypothetical protein